MTSTRSLSVSLNIFKSSVYNTEGENYRVTEYAKNKLIEYNTQRVWYVSADHRLFSLEFVATSRENTGGYLVFQYSFTTSEDALSVTIPKINVIGPVVFTGTYEVDGNYVGGNYLESDLVNYGNNRYARPSIYVSKSDSWMTSPLAELPDPQYDYNYSYTSDYSTMTFPVDPSTTYYVYLTVPAGFKKLSYANKSVHFLSEYFENVTETYMTDNITCSFSVDGETQLSDGTYKLTAGTGAKTVSYSVTSDYPWTGTLKVGSDEYTVSSSSSSVDVTLSKSAWTSTQSISLSVTNSYNTATASKTYHIGQGPGGTTKTTNTYVGVDSGRSGTYSTPVTYWGSALVVDSVDISDEYIIDYFNITENSSFEYNVNIPEGSNGSSTITINYHDEYGSGSIVHTFNVRLIPSPEITLPASIIIGDTTTIINSSITTGVTETAIYRWQIMKPGSTAYEDIPGYVWVEKSKNLEYVFNSADQYKIKLIASLDGLDGAGYYKEYSATPYSPVPEPDFTISPATLYANRNINLHSLTGIINPPNLDAVSPLNLGGCVLDLSSIATVTPPYVDISATNIVNPPYLDAEPPSSHIDIILDLSNAGSVTPPYVDIYTTGYSYEWFVDNISVGNTLDATTTVNTPGTHTVKLIVSLGQYSRSVTKTINVNTIAPTLSFNITPSEGMSYGDTVTCTNTSREVTVTPPATPVYKWTITGSKGDTYVYTSKNCSFTVGKSSRYTIKLDATTEGITSTSVSRYITPLEYYDPIRRYSVVIINDKKAIICSKSQSPYRMNNLQFEKRLNETGSGSMDLLVNNEDNKPDLLASGSDVIIFDNVHPIYFGVITSVNNNNINPFNKALTKSYYSIEFSEGCRKLSYRQCENSEVITAPYDDIFNMITEVNGTNPYTGDVDNFINEYSFSVSNQDMLSQIDSLGEQCGARYRTGIYTYGEFEDALYYSSQYIKRTGGFGVRVPKGSYVFCVGDDGLAIHKVSSDYTTTTDVYLPTSELCKVGSLIVNNPVRAVIIKPNPIIDFKQTYYSDCVIPADNAISDVRYRNALAINRTCYDVDDDDSINKHYGKVVCTSPQIGSPNVVASFELVQPMNESNQFLRCAYVSYCTCPKVVQVSVSGGGRIADIVVDDPNINKSTYGNYIYCPVQTSNEEYWTYIKIRDLSVWTNNYAYIDSGITKYGTRMQYAIELPWGNWNENTIHGLVGLHLFGTWVRCISSGTSPFSIQRNDRVNIGGTEYNVSDVNYSGGDEWNIFIDHTSSITREKFPLSIPIGSLVMKTNSTPTDSPYSKYKDRCLSVTLQNNMDYHEVSLLTSNIARYGSNFTKEVNGTCSIKVFRNRFTNLYPLPGEHVALYYDDGSSPSDKSKYYHDYELVSYTINTQTMTVDFVMGMQPLNVGDVIYRIKQNMTTNITSS